MSQLTSSFLLHIGPLRQESVRVIQQMAVPGYVVVPEFTKQAQRALEEQPGILVQADIVTPSADRKTRFEYSLAEFNSLAPASELKTLYPGLVEKNRTPIETTPLPVLLSQSPLVDQGITHLLLEQPEQALALLQTLDTAGALNWLKQLWVRTSEHALYVGMATQTELTQWCQAQGLEVTSVEDDDPDYVLLGFTRNKLFKPLQVATDRVKALSEDIKTLKRTNEGLAQRLEAQANYAEQAEKREAEHQQEADALHQQIEKQGKAQESVRQEMAELKKERDQLKKQRDEEAKAKETAKKEAASFKQERNALKSQLTQQKEQSKRVDQDMQETKQKQ